MYPYRCWVDNLIHLWHFLQSAWCGSSSSARVSASNMAFLSASERRTVASLGVAADTDAVSSSGSSSPGLSPYQPPTPTYPAPDSHHRYWQLLVALRPVRLPRAHRVRLLLPKADVLVAARAERAVRLDLPALGLVAEILDALGLGAADLGVAHEGLGHERAVVGLLGVGLGLFTAVDSRRVTWVV